MMQKKTRTTDTETVIADSTKTNSELRARKMSERLIDAAAQFFMEKGYDSTSMGEIAKFAHASKETFYRHFPTKEDLFRAVVLQRAQKMTMVFSATLSPGDPPVKALTVFGELMLEKLLAAQATGFYRVISMERERFPELVEMYHQQGPAKIHAKLSNYLKEQNRRGLLRKVDTMTAARQFFDLVVAEVIIGSTFSVKKSLTKAEIKQRIAEAVDCFLNGYAASTSRKR